jgi:hypothetical protein
MLLGAQSVDPRFFLDGSELFFLANKDSRPLAGFPLITELNESILVSSITEVTNA